MVAYWSLSRAPLTKTLSKRALKIAQIESLRDSIFIFVFDTGGEQKGLPIKETLTDIFLNISTSICALLNPQGKPKSLQKEASIVVHGNLKNAPRKGGTLNGRNVRRKRLVFKVFGHD